jgi:hypothetical protein
MRSNKQTKRAAKKPAPRKRAPKPAPKKRAGRPTKYLAIFAEQAKLLCERGATDRELADFFRVSITTVQTWQALHSEFLAALKMGKDFADDRVERSLYQRAVGYTFDAVKVFAPTDRRGPALVAHREHCPPDVGAQKLWLTNRRRDAWRDRQDHELSGKDGRPIETRDVSEMTSNERARRVAFALIARALAPESTGATDGEVDRRSDQTSGT